MELYEENISKLPTFLVEMLKKQYGENISKKIIEGYSLSRPVTFRVNTLKSDTYKVENILKENKIEYKKVLWSNEAYILRDVKESVIRELDIYKNGEIYLQSLSSMIPAIILDPKIGADILDMAAAPGGKTTQIATLTNNSANITACELNKIRAERLKYNIEKQGATSVYIMEKDARNINDFFSFNQILLDTPCSGSGTININNSKLKEIFTEKLVKKSKESQLALLNKAIKILKPEGEMIYSTCSILKEENEENINQMLSKYNIEIIPIDLTKYNNIPILPTNILGTVCICPDELYEGFFIAKIKKNK